jgi:hypothetical protein
VVAACHVIATAIEEHIERLADPVNLGHISSDEAHASSRRVSERAPLRFLDRSRREIHADYLKAVRSE